MIETARVYTRLDELITAAKANEVSLAVFKPVSIREFIGEEEEEREWNPAKTEEMRNKASQGDLFAEEWRKTFKVIPKLPYSFSYRFVDADGRESKLQMRLPSPNLEIIIGTVRFVMLSLRHSLCRFTLSSTCCPCGGLAVGLSRAGWRSVFGPHT